MKTTYKHDNSRNKTRSEEIFYILCTLMNVVGPVIGDFVVVVDACQVPFNVL